MMGDEPSFSDKDQEVDYWRNLAKHYQDEYERVQKESDEFISESQQLEKEYEATIDQNEKKIKELTMANNRAHNEAEALRVKLEESNKANNEYQTEMEKLIKTKTDLQQNVRELEQKNDDLERSLRIIQESIAGIETAFHSAIERNAILESEMDEKDSLKEKMQRLVDETRDLKQELMVKDKDQRNQEGNERLVNGFNKSIVDSNRLKENETQTSPAKNEQFQSNISPASRLMALNIVSDLIRKVGSLERRLQKSRFEFSPTDLRNRHSAKNTPASSIQSFTK